MFDCCGETSWPPPLAVERAPLHPTGDAVAEAARRALLLELSLHPKPGLVSFVDSGSHADMDAGHFLASIRALEPYFARVFAAGRRGEGFPALRSLGLDAEAAMLSATGGVNTHRGAVFCLGLLAAAAGGLAADERPATGPALAGEVAAAWGADILDSLATGPASNGMNACLAYGLGGVRVEAASGFPTILRAASPALEQALSAGADREGACAQCLFAAMAVAEDTTLVHRGGVEGLAFARGTAAAFLGSGGVFAPDWRSRALAAHHAFTARRLSPGGAADLLSATLFLRFLEKGTW